MELSPENNLAAATALTLLPPELLGEIFCHCLAFCADAPLLLSRVSKSFHQVVHSTPGVWQHLRLKTSLATDSSTTGCAAEDKAAFWFGKVGSCLVDMKVEIITPSQSRSVSGSGASTPVGLAHPRLALLGVLRERVDRIRSLDIVSASELDARVFLNAIYDSLPSPTNGVAGVALESLTVSVSSTTPPNLRLSSSSLKFPLGPLLPRLRSLTLTNHTIDFLVSSALNTSTSTPSTPSTPSASNSTSIAAITAASSNDPFHLSTIDPTAAAAITGGTFENLRHLSVICPIRFAPLQVSSILYILRSMPRLESIVVESRMVEGPSGPPSLSSIGSDNNSTGSPVSTGGPASSLPTSPAAGAAFGVAMADSEVVDAASGADHPMASASPASPTFASPSAIATSVIPTLVHLPHLRSLSLRSNAIPAVLSQLLLPNLDRLHIEDLNGKRAGGSKETADVLRQVLVRMELPNSFHDKTRTAGLRVLEVGGVDVVLGGGGGDAKTTWEWCFKRMVTLEELAISKMSDPMSLFELFAPRPIPTPRLHSHLDGSTTPYYSHHSSRSPSPSRVCPSPVDVVCPNLRRLALTCVTCLFTSPQNRLIVDQFNSTRPNVELDIEVVKDPFYQSMLTGPVDFLSLYSDMRPQNASTTTPDSLASPTGGVKRGSNANGGKSFGPWVVLT